MINLNYLTYLTINPNWVWKYRSYFGL